MCVDDAMHDCESKAGAFLARREERIEDALTCLGWNTGTGILDGKDDELATRAIRRAQACFARGEGDFARAFERCGHAVPFESPRRFVWELGKFLATHRQETRPATVTA